MMAHMFPIVKGNMSGKTEQTREIGMLEAQE
jgi:hypothetical protein